MSGRNERGDPPPSRRRPMAARPARDGQLREREGGPALWAPEGSGGRVQATPRPGKRRERRERGPSGETPAAARRAPSGPQEAARPPPMQFRCVRCRRLPPGREGQAGPDALPLPSNTTT